MELEEKIPSVNAVDVNNRPPSSQIYLLPSISSSPSASLSINSTSSNHLFTRPASVAISSSSQSLRLLLVSPPPLSDLALASGIILEGYIEKKSSLTGMWLMRYYTLCESTSQFCVLKIFGHAKKSSWGVIPLDLKIILPIRLIDSIDTPSDSKSMGREFAITYQLTSDVNMRFTHSSALSSKSDSEPKAKGWPWNNKTKTLRLRAQDPQSRLLWTTVLSRCLACSLE